MQSSGSCPVEPLAREVAAHPPRENREAEAEMDRISRRIAALSEVASYRRAASPGGSMFQLGLISAEIDVLYDKGTNLRPDDPKTRSDLIVGINRADDRNLYSVLAFLERASGESREPVAGEVYMPRRIDPFEEGIPLAAGVTATEVDGWPSRW